MQKINNTIQLSIIALNGAFIGAMILIALVLVPFWQSLQPPLFLDWFTAHSNNIGRLMIPLGPGVLCLAMATFFLSQKNKIWWGLTIIFTLFNILYFPIYFLSTNTSFAEQTIEIAQVSDTLSTWLSYHWHRIFFATAALVTTIVAILKNQADI